MTREEILTIAKPILFNTDMVGAILEARKTATRRILKLPRYIKKQENGLHTLFADGTCYENQHLEEIVDYIKPPYKVGDYLYVRETWMVQVAKRYDALVRIGYRAGGKNTTIHFPYGGTDSINRDDYDAFVGKWNLDRWYPSIHMPKEAARIFLRVTDVRLEQLQDMDTPNKEHFVAEGAKDKHDFIRIWYETMKLDEREKYGWYADPWVWVIEFERVKV